MRLDELDATKQVGTKVANAIPNGAQKSLLFFIAALFAVTALVDLLIYCFDAGSTELYEDSCQLMLDPVREWVSIPHQFLQLFLCFYSKRPITDRCLELSANETGRLFYVSCNAETGAEEATECRMVSEHYGRSASKTFGSTYMVRYGASQKSLYQSTLP